MSINRVLVSLFGLVVSYMIQANERPLVQLVTTVYPPYHDPSLNNSGFQDEIVKEAFQRAGYQAEINYMVWARVMREGRRGVVDGIVGLWKRSERLKDFAYSMPIGRNEVVFFKLIGKRINFQNYQDLKPYVIGVVRGYVNPPEIDNADYLSKEIVDNNIQAFKMLLDKRIDIAILDKNVGNYLINLHFPEKANQLEWVSPVSNIEIQYVGFSKRAENYQKKLRDFNRGLEEIKQDGTYQRILMKHGINE